MGAGGESAEIGGGERNCSFEGGGFVDPGGWKRPYFPSRWRGVENAVDLR